MVKSSWKNLASMKTYLTHIVLALILMSVLLGCSTKLTFPTCPRLADSKPSLMRNIGADLYSFCDKNGITITPVGENIAEFRGSRKNMINLENTYHILVCDFDQKSTDFHTEEYTACVVNLKEWINEIRKQPVGNVLTDGTQYCLTCVSNNHCKIDTI